MELEKLKLSPYEQYEELLIKNETIRKESEQIWIQYLSIFGKLITDVYEAQIECIRLKKIISTYQAYINRGETIDHQAIYEQIEREMTAYRLQLEQMIKDTNEAAKGTIISPLEVRNIKVLYRRIAKRLHPDMHPDTNKQEVLKELWIRVQMAYHANDLKRLSELEVLVNKALKDQNIQVEIPNIEEKIQMVEDEIDSIIHNEPYTLKSLLEDSAKRSEKKNELQEQLKAFQKYQKELQSHIEELETKENIPWQMN